MAVAVAEMPGLPELCKAETDEILADVSPDAEGMPEDGYQAAADELDRLSQSIVRILLDVQAKLAKDRRELLLQKSATSLPAEQTCERVRAVRDKVWDQAAKKYLLSPEDEEVDPQCDSNSRKAAAKKYFLLPEDGGPVVDSANEASLAQIIHQWIDDEMPDDMAAPQGDLEVSHQAPRMPSPEAAYGRLPGEVLKHVINTHDAINTHTGDNALNLSSESGEKPPGLCLSNPPGLPTSDSEEQDKGTVEEGDTAEVEAPQQHDKEAIRRAISGDWKNHKGKNYTMIFTDDVLSVETGDEHGEHLRIQLCPDAGLNCFWWGSHHFMDIDELMRKPSQICWYDAADKNKSRRRVSFAWKRPHMQPSALLVTHEADMMIDDHRLNRKADQMWKDAYPYLARRTSKISNWMRKDESECLEAEPGSSSGDPHGTWNEVPSSSYSWYTSADMSRTNTRKQEEVWNCLKGIWLGHKSETYELRLLHGSEPCISTWACTRHNQQGSKRFKLRWDEQHWLVWWGSSFWLDADELLKKRSFASWYVTQTDGFNKICFRWYRSTEQSGVNFAEWDPASWAQVPQSVGAQRWQIRKEKNKRGDDTEATIFDL